MNVAQKLDRFIEKESKGSARDALNVALARLGAIRNQLDELKHERENDTRQQEGGTELGESRAQLVKDFISSMEHAAERAHDETDRWHGTDTTYGDTSYDAASASHGEATAYEAAAAAGWRLLKQLEQPQ